MPPVMLLLSLPIFAHRETAAGIGALFVVDMIDSQTSCEAPVKCVARKRSSADDSLCPWIITTTFPFVPPSYNSHKLRMPSKGQGIWKSGGDFFAVASSKHVIECCPLTKCPTLQRGLHEAAI